MPCYHPITAWRSKEGRKNGKWPIVFKRQEGYTSHEMKVPCGQCIGCKLERSRQWAIRCTNEASLYEKNCFITLTYSPENLSPDGSLKKRDFVLFMKRLRKKYGEQIRFFHCGEYGENFNRPHHHACIFNHDFEDKYHWNTLNSIPVYRSEQLEKLWPFGFCTIGTVTWDSAAYVARYCTKKITGEKAEAHYQGKEPEYVTMSRNPGIGKAWYDKYKSDLFTHDMQVIRDGLIVKPAKYYDKQFDIDEKFKMDCFKYRRQKNVNVAENEIDRLLVKEKITHLRMNKLPRLLEVET